MSISDQARSGPARWAQEFQVRVGEPSSFSFPLWHRQEAKLKRPDATHTGFNRVIRCSARAIRKIRGFGNSYTAALVSWREGLERSFRFDPNEPVDPQEIAALDQKLGQQQQQLVNQLQQAPQVLRSLSLEIQAGRKRLMPLLQRLWDDVKMAEAREAAL